MIRADVEFLDLDPAQWAVLNELVLEARRLRRWGYVLHREGCVVTRHPADIAVSPGDDVADAAAMAERLRLAGGFDRVVVIDQTGLPAIARAGAELIEPDGDLTRYRERVDALYWSSPAVVTSPGAPANPWLEMRACTESLRSGLILVSVVSDAGVVVTSIALQVDAGGVTRISSPRTDQVPDVVIACTTAELVAAIRSARFVEELLDAASRNPRSSGLELLSIDRPAPTTQPEGQPAHAS